uniref:Uncharacterized protein n=1 Tax=Clastoptera arizonana TaxID=38151 RepID=A0A1B6CC17_9HEMI
MLTSKQISYKANHKNVNLYKGYFLSKGSLKKLKLILFSGSIPSLYFSTKFPNVFKHLSYLKTKFTVRSSQKVDSCFHVIIIVLVVASEVIFGEVEQLEIAVPRSMKSTNKTLMPRSCAGGEFVWP